MQQKMWGTIWVESSTKLYWNRFCDIIQKDLVTENDFRKYEESRKWNRIGCLYCELNLIISRKYVTLHLYIHLLRNSSFRQWNTFTDVRKLLEPFFDTFFRVLVALQWFPWCSWIVVLSEHVLVVEIGKGREVTSLVNRPDVRYK
jgi:hypothetical protein